MALNVQTIIAIAMGICFMIDIFLIAIQIKAFQWYSSVKNDNNTFAQTRERFCLFGVYILAALCSLQCLLNHTSKYFPEWFCRYGMSLCVVLHEAAKTSQYGFFLERAKSAIAATKIDILPAVMQSIITKYILPIYISLYCILYTIICPLTFRGLPTNRNNQEPTIPTDCLFDQFKPAVFFLSIFVELFNSIFFVFLFAYPLCKINNAHIEVVKMVKYNIIFSSISCISSVAFLLYRALSMKHKLNHYLWLAGNTDLVINTIFTYLMVTANRKYFQYCQNRIVSICTTQNKASQKTDTEINKTDTKIINKEDTIQNKSLIEMDSMLNQTIGTNDKVIKCNESVPIEVNESEDLTAKTTDTVTTTVYTIVTTKIYPSCTAFPISVMKQ